MKSIAFLIAISLFIPAFTNAQIWEEKTKTLPLAHYQELAHIPGTSKFLMFGGIVHLTALDDTYIYDVEKSTWQEVKCKDKPYPRTYHSMAPLTDGKVLVYGGEQQIPTGTSYAYDTDLFVFDLASNNWSKLKNKTSIGNLIGYDAIQIDDGKVLFFKHKETGYKSYEAFIYLYNYFTNSWSTINAGNAPQQDKVTNIVKYDNNKILLITQPETSYPEKKPYTTWTFDITTNTWDSLATFDTPITADLSFYYSIASNLGNKKFLLITETKLYDAKVYFLFDGNTNKWTDISNKHYDTHAEIYNMYGYGEDKTLVFYTDYSNKVDIFDIADTSFTTVLQDFVPPEPLGRRMFPISEDKMLSSIFNSFRTGKSNNLWIYNKRTDKWSFEPLLIDSSEKIITSNYIGNNETLFWKSTSNSMYADIFKYNSLTNVWTFVQTIYWVNYFYNQNIKFFHYENGDCFMVGTKYDPYLADDKYDSFKYYKYDFSKNEFSFVGEEDKMVYINKYGMCKFSDSTLIMFGGEDYNNLKKKDTYIFDIPSLTWSKIPTSFTPTKRLFPYMTPLGNGRMFMHGGKEYHFDSDDWIFDIKDSSWTVLTQNTKPFYHSDYSLAAFPDGTLMLMSEYGWYWLSNENLVSVEDSKYPLLHNLSPELALSPNPANSSTSMNYIIKKISQYAVEVCNLEGKVLIKENLGMLGAGFYNTQLDISQLSPGSYFVRLYELSGIETTQQLKILK